MKNIIKKNRDNVHKMSNLFNNYPLICSLFLFSFVLMFTCVAQIPPRPNPPRLVNDFANILSSQERNELEQRLVAFNDSTSNVICVVIVNDFNGLTAAEYAYEIGDKWGVKDKKTGKNNGVVILVKPKNETSGEARIEVGYDLEGVLPDAFAARVVDEEMIPRFKENDYYEGISDGLDVILPIVAKEITYRDYEKKDRIALIVVCVIFGLMVAFVVLIILKAGKKNGNGGSPNGGNSSGQSDVWKWLLLGSLLSGGNRGGSRGGGGSFGGGGGFGGFGGRGGFGGGGGGGKW